jgi:hypothetical protein
MDERHNMNFVNHHLDMIKAGVAAITYFGITLTDANEVLKFGTGILTAGYLIYKWRKDIKGK